MKTKLKREHRIILITAILVVVACAFAVYLRLFTGKELWYEMFAAVLGVIITAIITMVLLRGQSDTDIERERAAKVFEEKLRIYQEYLSTLQNVIQDGCLSDEEKMRLEFQTSYVAMHCASENIAEISVAVREIIEYKCSDDQLRRSADAGRSNSPEYLLEKLFRIVEAFRKDLYGEDFIFSPEYLDMTLENFSTAYRNAKEGAEVDKDERQHLVVDLNVLSKDAETVVEQLAVERDGNEPLSAEAVDGESLDKLVGQWRASGWNVLVDSENDSLRIEKEGNPGQVFIECYYGKYRLRAGYLNDADFSKPLKWDRGGKRSHGVWWQYLPEPYYSGIEKGKMLSCLSLQEDFQKYVSENISQLMTVIEVYHRTVSWKNALGAHERWKIFIWYWNTLACEFDCAEEGVPYMDIMETEKGSGKVVVQFSNRQNNKELLGKTLQRIGCGNLDIQEDGYVVLDEIESTDSNAVADRLTSWINKISAS